MRIKVSFPIERVQMLRSGAEAAYQDTGDAPEGWSISRADPMKLLEAFPVLHIKNGYCLKAYHYRSQTSSNTVVWALPVRAVFPDPSGRPEMKGNVLEPPKPEEALSDIMQAIGGDGSPWSYLCATIFAREVSELGASGQGCSWRMHSIIGKDPFCFSTPSEKWNPMGPLQGMTSTFEGWKWLGSKPEEWRPCVYLSPEANQVVFHTFSGAGCQSLYCNRDTYDQGSYCFLSEERIIAVGPGGFEL